MTDTRINKFRGAVLVIGSLYWEDETNSLKKWQGKRRSDWRKSLDQSRELKIDVPIRYGRMSESRRSTYTMLFSTSSKLGKAYVIPFRKAVATFAELRKQAEDLAFAESIATKDQRNRIIEDWGAVGLGTREGLQGFDSFLEEWRKEFSDFCNSAYGIGSERPCITEDGLLSFPIGIPDGIDYVLATPLVPNVTAYPDIEEVLRTALTSKPQYSTYIVKNILCGIRVDGDKMVADFVNEVRKYADKVVAADVLPV